MAVAKTRIKRVPLKRIPTYEQIIEKDDDKINVLVLGTSGCGKSTLINAILEANEAPTGVGEAVTREIAVYQNDRLPFRMIDSVGYEYGLLRQAHIKKDIAKFCKEGVKSADVEKLIHVIWFCIDGTSKRISQDVLDYIKSVTNDWKNVPVIVVFTKSYSRFEIDENIAMAKKAFGKYNYLHRRRPINVKGIIPVVAKEYKIDNDINVFPMGLDTLVRRTIELVPEAKQLERSTIREIDLKLKNSMANTVIAASAAGAAAIGAIPIPIPDSTILVPLQTGMLTRISKIYGIQDKEASNEIVNTILKVGATTIAGRTLLSAFKAIPGLGIAASVLNAAVAGAITLAAGEISNALFQKVYDNKLEMISVDWNKEIARMFNEYLPNIVSALKKISDENGGKIDMKLIGEALASIAKSYSRQMVKA